MKTQKEIEDYLYKIQVDLEKYPEMPERNKDRLKTGIVTLKWVLNK